MDKFSKTIRAQLKTSAATIDAVADQADMISQMAERLVATYKDGGKILAFGNG